MTVTATGAASPIADGLSIVRAVARALWDAGAGAQQLALQAGDDAARCRTATLVAARRRRSASVIAEMNTDPQQIRARVDAVLADLPRVDPEASEDADVTDIDAVGRRLEEAHQILVDALESVEKG